MHVLPSQTVVGSRIRTEYEYEHHEEKMQDDAMKNEFAINCEERLKRKAA